MVKGNPTFELIDDAVVKNTPLFGLGNSDLCGYEREVIMTKELFIECYNKWIAGKEQE